MRIRLTTFAAFRAIALLGCAAMLAVRTADALSLGTEALRQQIAACQVLAMLAMRLAPADPVHGYAGLLVASFALYALAFAWRTSPRFARGGVFGGGLLVAQIAVGALVESDLLYLASAELAFVMPSRSALRWLGVIGASYVAATVPELLQGHANAAGGPHCNVAGVLPPSAPTMAALDWALELAFQAFAFAVGLFASAEWRNREAVAWAHAEQARANAELDSAVRAAEQARITQRVHQALGQHAGTLQRHLAAAGRQASPRAAAAVAVASDQAQRLAAEVEAAVRGEVASADVDLRQMLRGLCAGLPSLRVHLECEDAAGMAPALAHVVFRVVQEALSNCLRHAGATVARVVVASVGGALTIAIEDDGHGSRANDAGLRSGNGLRGMRERVEAQGGRFSAANLPEGGFAVHVSLPVGVGAR